MVLIVDDEDDIRRPFVLYLHSVGFEAYSARDAVDALRQLKDRLQPCGMLIDVAMPEIDGWELSERLRSDPKLATIPIVLHSGYAEDPERARRLGIGAYIMKPAHPEKIAGLLAIFCPHNPDGAA